MMKTDLVFVTRFPQYKPGNLIMTIRQYLRKPFVAAPAAEPVDLAGRRIIVTGCSPGSLGYASAIQLAGWGATVIVSTRHDTADVVSALEAKLYRENRAGTVAGHSMDLADAASVSQFTGWYTRLYGRRLDVLVNNAADP
jgi:retinol dehydrogenase-12